jgi:hypothetical protein
MYAVLLLTAPGNPSPLRAQQQSLSPENLRIVQTMNKMFDAAQADDIPKFNSVVATHFYMFDGGVRFTGEAP